MTGGLWEGEGGGELRQGRPVHHIRPTWQPFYDLLWPVDRTSNEFATFRPAYGRFLVENWHRSKTSER